MEQANLKMVSLRSPLPMVSGMTKCLPFFSPCSLRMNARTLASAFWMP